MHLCPSVRRSRSTGGPEKARNRSAHVTICFSSTALASFARSNEATRDRPSPKCHCSSHKRVWKCDSIYQVSVRSVSRAGIDNVTQSYASPTAWKPIHHPNQQWQLNHLNVFGGGDLSDEQPPERLTISVRCNSFPSLSAAPAFLFNYEFHFNRSAVQRGKYAKLIRFPSSVFSIFSRLNAFSLLALDFYGRCLPCAPENNKRKFSAQMKILIMDNMLMSCSNSAASRGGHRHKTMCNQRLCRYFTEQIEK